MSGGADGSRERPVDEDASGVTDPPLSRHPAANWQTRTIYWAIGILAVAMCGAVLAALFGPPERVAVVLAAASFGTPLAVAIIVLAQLLPPVRLPPARSRGGKIVGAMALVAVLAGVSGYLVADGRDIVTVPDVQMMSLADAGKRLDTAHLVVGELDRRDADRPVDLVLGQDPDAGEKADAEDEIALEVSDGVEVPAVVGAALAAATTELEHAGLKVGKIKNRFDSNPIGTVLSQDPTAAAHADPGSPVALVTSSGVRVPNVVGRTVALARRVLTRAGFDLSFETRLNPRETDVVEHQSPKAGDGANHGTNVEVGLFGYITAVGRCPSESTARDAIGVAVQRLDPPEICGFMSETAATVKCPVRWICEWGEGGEGAVTVRVGAGQEAVVFGGTWRYAPAYPSQDRVRDVCRFLERAQQDKEATYFPDGEAPDCP